MSGLFQRILDPNWGETQFQTNFVQMGFSKTLIVYQGFWIQNGGKLNFKPILSKWISNISKTLKALVYEGFLIQNGGNLISDQFCPNGYFNNFDSISISGILDQKWGKLNFRPILSKWVFQKL